MLILMIPRKLYDVGHSRLGAIWDVFSTSQIGHFHLGTRWKIFKTPQLLHKNLAN